MAAPASNLDSSLSTPSSYEEEPSFTSHAWQDNTTLSDSVTQSPSSTTAVSSTATHPTKGTPLQKRRRVTRACDECRRKKIKCDGKQPCTHCTVYSYDCTYDQPSNRRRNPTPQYVENLEVRAHRMEALLKVLLPDVDVNSPSLDFNKLPQLRQASDRLPTGKGVKQDYMAPASQDALLESMVEAAGRLDIDESGHVDFHGHSSGFTYLNKLREQLGDSLGQTNTLLRFPPPVIASISSGIFDSPQSSGGSPSDSLVVDNTPLPRREIAELLVNSCLNEACILFRFIHRPSFDVMFHRIFSINMEDYGSMEHRFLPLLYLALAVGCAFASDPEKLGFANGTIEGIKYFQAGRRLVEITDCRDSTSIQCVLLMILFLQSSARMATCYSYVGIALSASLRMGYHRKLPFSDPLEAEIRKRIFWTVRKMGIYVGTLLGLPKGIQDEDIDQEYPLELDDQYITKDGILQAPSGEPSSIAAANAHTKLLRILDKVGKNIYPIKGLQLSTSGRRAGYMVSYSTVHELEEELEKWQKELPMYLRRGEDAPIRFVRSQNLLRMSYAHVKMMLYRPFIHYIARPRDGRVRDERPYASAAECINVSREIIHICDEMKRKNILNGAYWFNIYSTFFAVISLVYFVLENISHPDAPAMLRDATLGKDCLMSLRDRSMAAERCCLSLKSLFDQLPSKLQAGYFPSSANKKRTREIPLSSLSSHSRSLANTDVNINQPSRSKTFPSTPDTEMPFASNKSSSLVGPDVNPTYETSYMSGTISRKLSFHQHLGGAGGMPDLNAFMFPSSSTYAYENQALPDPSIFKSTAQTSPLSAFAVGLPPASNSVDSITDPAYDILEAQLYGPLPPYLYQGQVNQVEAGNSFSVDELSGNSNTESGNFAYQTANTNKANNYPVNLDEFFSTAIDETEWDDMLLQNNYR